MSLPEIVSGDGPPPDSPMPTPPLPVITLPVIPDALTPKLDSWSPVPELLLIVLLTTPTVTLLPNVNPPLPLLCTTLFHTSADPFCDMFTPQPLLWDTVQAFRFREEL